MFNCDSYESILKGRALFVVGLSRKAFLDKIDGTGFSKQELSVMQYMIDTEDCDPFKVTMK